MQRTSLLCGIAALALASTTASAADKAGSAGVADAMRTPVGVCPGGILPDWTMGLAGDAMLKADGDVRPGDIVIVPADLTDDGLIDYGDVLKFFSRWDAGDPSVDLTGDGLVDWSDYLVFMNFYEAVSPPLIIDFAPDGVIDIRDLDAFMYYFEAFDRRADINGDGLIDYVDVLDFLNLLDAMALDV